MDQVKEVQIRLIVVSLAFLLTGLLGCAIQDYRVLLFGVGCALLFSVLAFALKRIDRK